MSKKSEYQNILFEMFHNNTIVEIRDYLINNANLPSPQMNLTLSEAFANCFLENDIQERYQKEILKWSDIVCSNEEPMLILPFCAVRALGHFFDMYNQQHHKILFFAMDDNRWRMRESAAMCLQHFGEHHADDLQMYMKHIYPNSTYTQKRAIIAGLAHPPILKQNASLCEFALHMTNQILQDVYAQEPNRKDDGYIALYKGLSYAISVFTAYLPAKGFAYMKTWALHPDKDVKRILKANLTKARITKPFPEECSTLKAML